MIVEEIMSPSPVMVDIAMSVGDTILKMLEYEVKQVPVIKNGEYIGMISDRELQNFAYPVRSSSDAKQDYRKTLLTKVSEVVNTDLPVVHPEMELVALIDLVLSTGAGALAVVDPLSGELLGLVTQMDVIKGARTLFDD